MQALPGMCSTPLGHHGVYRCGAPDSSATGSTSAQRLSASRSISATLEFGRFDGPLDVLNASRHHGVYRRGGACRGEARLYVLNASRHHGVYRSGFDFRLRRRNLCSTPLGITEYIGRPVRRSRKPWPLGAQRLSASRSISATTAQQIVNLLGAQRLSASRSISDPADGKLRGEKFRCSTPLGITEYIGRWCRSRTAAAHRVLNASRHHGVYREDRFREKCYWTWACAQRLSASRSISVGGAPDAGYRQGAQRLSASRSISERGDGETWSAFDSAQRLSASRSISVRRSRRPHRRRA